MKIKILFFVAIALFIIAFINISDIHSFNLQQAGIAAFGEANSFDLNKVDNSRWQNLGDTINYKKQKIALKAPGLFIFSGLVYKLLLLFDTSYSDSYFFISSLMLILFSSLPIVLLSYYYYKLLFLYNPNNKENIITTLLLVCGTMLLSYSGVLIHDNLAMLLLLISFYNFKKYKNSKVCYFYLGISLFFSYKMIIISILFLIYYLFNHKKISNILYYFAGVLPLLIWQYIMFGNPLLTPHYVFTKNLDVFPKVYNLKDIFIRFYFYILSLDTSIWINNIILIPAIVGLLYGVKNKNKDYIFILLSFSLYLAYLLSISTVGDCQYPPRYLIYFIPFLLLGLNNIYDKIKTTVYGIIFLTFVILSIFTNMIAACFTVMNCDYQNNIWQLFIFKGSFNSLLTLLIDLPFLILLPLAILFLFVYVKESKFLKES